MSSSASSPIEAPVDSPVDSPGTLEISLIIVVVFVFAAIITVKMCILAVKRRKCIRRPKTIRRAENVRDKKERELAAPDPRFQTLTMDKFLNDMEKEKPIRFTAQQLRIATDNFTNLLGFGGFGSVHKGIFGDGTVVAVKVLYGGISDKRIEEQFMAEVSTLGRIHHFNLVRLYGFCFEWDLRALVYEFMGNGSLDKFLFHPNKAIEFSKLHEIAVGTARGIAYLHEECQQRIIHYDIKPANILLDANFHPKVADFGLAKLINRESTHITMTRGRGTPGYAAPELWMPFPVTHKCDVYSFGMLLFEIIGRRKNVDESVPDSQEWFPRWVWKMFDNREVGELIIVCAIEEKDKEVAERMVKVALLCVQHSPQLRLMMGDVVKMLEGALEIPMPSNPFQHMMSGIPYPVPSHSMETSSIQESDSSLVPPPVMKRCEIEIAST